MGSRFLLSGLLKCGVCGRPYSAQGAKSGQFAYYICGTLFREGAGTCSARYLNAPKLEAAEVTIQPPNTPLTLRSAGPTLRRQLRKNTDAARPYTAHRPSQ